MTLRGFKPSDNHYPCLIFSNLTNRICAPTLVLLSAPTEARNPSRPVPDMWRYLPPGNLTKLTEAEGCPSVDLTSIVALPALKGNYRFLTRTGKDKPRLMVMRADQVSAPWRHTHSRSRCGTRIYPKSTSLVPAFFSGVPYTSADRYQGTVGIPRCHISVALLTG